MSITAYFGKRRAGLRMPRKDGVDPATGLRYEGDVLNGKLSVTEAILREALTVRSSAWPAASSDVGYDPVLRSHLRLDEPESE